MKISDLNINPNVKMLREFGIFALFGFGGIGLLLGLKWGMWQVSYVLWALAVFSFVFAFSSLPMGTSSKAILGRELNIV